MAYDAVNRAMMLESMGMLIDWQNALPPLLPGWSYHMEAANHIDVGSYELRIRATVVRNEVDDAVGQEDAVRA